MKKIKVNILTPPMTSQNVRGFLTPIIINKRNLLNLGIDFKFFNKNHQNLVDCDILFLNARFYGKRWVNEPVKIIEEIEKYKSSGIKIFYCDNYDSTALIRTEVLNAVDVYFKNMILKDKSQYNQSFYGGRIHTHFINNNYKIEDSDSLYSKPINKLEELNKIKVSWNYGLAHYGLIGSRVANLYNKIPLSILLKFPYKFLSPNRKRYNDVFCRISSSYSRETVAYHRKMINKEINKKYTIGRVNPLQYFNEMRNSKLIISPFGWGEFSLRDFETFLYGGILLKPDMSHLDTYPNFYIPNKTFIEFKWDLSNLHQIIENTLDNYKEKIEIAEYSQELYKYHLTSNLGNEEFCLRLSKILKENL